MTQLSIQTVPARPLQTRSTILLIEDDPFQARARETVLARHFARIERVADAAQAFIKTEEAGFSEHLALVIVGLHLPGMAGPAFVSELTARIPDVPVLVIGRKGEIAPDYEGENVQFLPHHVSSQDVLAASRDVLSASLPDVA